MHRVLQCTQALDESPPAGIVIQNQILPYLAKGYAMAFEGMMESPRRNQV